LRADRAVLVPTFYTDDAAGERVVAHPEKTATLAGLEAAIRAAGARGLRVALKPHVDRVDEGFRGEIAPTGPARERFFADYRAGVLEPLAALAGRHPGVVDRFVVATELCALAGADHAWRACVDVVRRTAPGVRVGVACNYDALVPGDRRPAPTGWLDALDFVGVDWFPGESDLDRPPGRLARDLDAVRRRSGLPVCFTELGSRADLPGGDVGQRERVAATIEDFRGRVDGFWLYNRFADDPGCDVERYTLAQPLMLHLLERFPR
jgi:hypothetical protein